MIYMYSWGQFLEAPDKSFKSFENCTVKLSVKETKWTSSEVRTHPNFLETLISKYDFGPVELPDVSRNGPLGSNGIKVKIDAGCGMREIFITGGG